MTTQWHFTVDGTAITVHQAHRDGLAKKPRAMLAKDNHFSYISSSGKFFSTRVGYGTRHYGTNWHSHHEIIRDAIKLGVLPRGHLEKLIALENRRERRRQRKVSASIVLHHAARAGIHLTGYQTRKLKRARGRQTTDLPF